MRIQRVNINRGLAGIKVFGKKCLQIILAILSHFISIKESGKNSIQEENTMDSQKMERYVKELEKMTLNLSTPNRKAVRNTEYLNHGGHVYCLLDEFVDDYTDLVNRITNEKVLQNRFSDRFIKKKLNEIVINAKVQNDRTKIEKELTDLIKEQEKYNTEIACYIPICGIELRLKELNIGKVTFVIFSKEDANLMFRSIIKIIDSNKSDEEIKKQQKKYVETQIYSIVNKVISKYVVIAENDKARELALIETRRALDILKFYIPSFHPPLTRKPNEGFKIDEVNVGIYGEVFTTERLCIVTSATIKKFSIHHELIGNYFPFIVDDTCYREMETRGLSRLSNIISKDYNSLNGYEKIVIRAIHWFVSQLSQAELENKLLNLTTCMETILTPRDNSPITNAIAEGIAIILGSTLDDRKKIKKLVKDLYGKRSAVSHGGKKEILVTDIGKLIQICGDLLLWLIENENGFTSQQDILNWIEEKKLTC